MHCEEAGGETNECSQQYFAKLMNIQIKTGRHDDACEEQRDNHWKKECPCIRDLIQWKEYADQAPYPRTVNGNFVKEGGQRTGENKKVYDDQELQKIIVQADFDTIIKNIGDGGVENADQCKWDDPVATLRHCE